MINYHYQSGSTEMRQKHGLYYLGLPGVEIPKELAHHLDTYQVSQQGVDRNHLEQQQGPCHKHHYITAGEVI